MESPQQEAQRTDRGARTLIVAASMIVVIAGLKAAASLILPFLIAVFLALITLPLLNWLQRKGIRTGLAVTVTLLMALGVLVGIAVFIGGSIKDFTAAAPEYQARLEALYADFTVWVEAHGLPVQQQLTLDMINPGQLVDVFTSSLRGLAAALSNLLLVLLFIIFILFEAAGFPAKLERAFGEQSSSARLDRIRTEVQRYLGLKTVVSLATGGLVGAAMAILQVDFPLLWGALAFLLNYVPNLGSIIAAIPPVLLTLLHHGPGRALAVALIFIAVNVTLGNFVEPHFMGRRLGLSTLVVFCSLVFWGWVWGPVGMLLSVPLTMILKIMLENTEDLRWVAVLLGAGADPPAAE